MTRPMPTPLPHFFNSYHLTSCNAGLSDHMSVRYLWVAKLSFHTLSLSVTDYITTYSLQVDWSAVVITLCSRFVYMATKHQYRFWVFGV